MKEYAKKPENTSRTIQSNSKASRQASASEILQAYKDRIEGKPVQRQSVDDEDLLQVKAAQQDYIKAVLQQYKERNIQRLPSEEDEELIQGKFDTTQRKELDENELLQGKFETTSTTEQEPVQREEKPNNTGLPDNLKTGIENLSGYSMDDVKVHYNSDKPAQLNALAYAQGTDIHVAPGQEKHLPHEAWHVVQQKQGRVQPTMQMQGVNVNDNEGLEKEADVLGNSVLQKKNTLNKSLHNTLAKPNILQRLKRSNVYKGGAELELRLGDAQLTFEDIPTSTKHEKDEVKKLIRLGMKGIDIDSIKKESEVNKKDLKGDNWALTIETSTGTYLDDNNKIKIALELILGGPIGSTINDLIIAADAAANGIKELDNKGGLCFNQAGNVIRDNIIKKERKQEMAKLLIANSSLIEPTYDTEHILSKDWSSLKIVGTWDPSSSVPSKSEWGIQVTMAVPVDEIEYVGKALKAELLNDVSVAKPKKDEPIWDAYDILQKWDELININNGNLALITNDYNVFFESQWSTSEAYNWENLSHVKISDQIYSDWKELKTSTIYDKLNTSIKENDESKVVPSIETLNGLAKILAAYVRGMDQGGEHGPKHSMMLVNKNPLQDIIANVASSMPDVFYDDFRNACVDLIVSKAGTTSAYQWTNAPKSLTVINWGEEMKTRNIDLVALYDTAHRSSQIGGLTSLNDISSAEGVIFNMAPVIEYRDLGSKKPSEMKAIFEKIRDEVDNIPTYGWDDYFDDNV